VSLDAPKRYHPLLVTLHWLVAVLALLNWNRQVHLPDQDYPNAAAAIHMAAA